MRFRIREISGTSERVLGRGANAWDVFLVLERKTWRGWKAVEVSYSDLRGEPRDRVTARCLRALSEKIELLTKDRVLFDTGREIAHA